MEKILMHKNVPVAEIFFCNNVITGVGKIFCEEHMPIGTHTRSLRVPFLQSWQRMRSIPKERKGVDWDMAMQSHVLSHGAGLTDCYWYKDPDSRTEWKDVSFWENGFSSNQNGLFGAADSFHISPDFTTDGCLEKTWVLIGKTPVLIKKDRRGIPSLCANEVVAAGIADILGLDHVPYFQTSVAGVDACMCPCFIQDDSLEFVNILSYHHDYFSLPLDSIIEKLGMRKFFVEMQAFDLLIGNTDRHEQNFGFFRNPDTLEFVSPAPLFDNGNCLHRAVTDEMKPYSVSRKEALRRLGRPPFQIPEDIVDVVYQVYSAYDLNPKAAVEELLKNRRELLC